MADSESILFLCRNIKKEDIFDKKILEIGSRNVNGSIKPYIMDFKPKEYIGIDIIEGKNVDLILPSERILEKFPEEYFDVIVASESFEHICEWKKSISNLKKVCKPTGIILFTVPSYGFNFHGFPFDFWRYELSDIENIFSDCIIEKIEQKTNNLPEHFCKIIKPIRFVEKNLSDYKLYSILYQKRIGFIPNSISKLPLGIKFRILRIRISGKSIYLFGKFIEKMLFVYGKRKW